MGEWIDVNDRLPEDSAIVLACHVNPDGSRDHAFARCEGAAWEEPGWDGVCNITHWQPLPALPTR